MTIVLGITASIAAYKAADLASQLRKAGCEVHVVMTHGATKFITPLTLQTLSRNPVTTDIFDEKAGWQPGHIELADRADLLLIAPASADILAKLAYGFADEALTAIALATKAPVLLAPAMNGKMWLHPATQKTWRCCEPRRRIHRTGRRNVSVRLRRHRPPLAGPRNRGQSASHAKKPVGKFGGARLPNVENRFAKDFVFLLRHSMPHRCARRAGPSASPYQPPHHAPYFHCSFSFASSAARSWSARAFFRRHSASRYFHCSRIAPEEFLIWDSILCLSRFKASSFAFSCESKS